MTARVCSLLALVLLSSCSATAQQPLPTTCVLFQLPPAPLDPDRPLVDAIEAGTRREIAASALLEALARADHARDPALIPALERLAESRAPCPGSILALSLTAMSNAGAPDEAALAWVRRWREYPEAARIALQVLGLVSDADYTALADSLQAVARAGRGRVRVLSNSGDNYRGAVEGRRMIRDSEAAALMSATEVALSTPLVMEYPDGALVVEIDQSYEWGVRDRNRVYAYARTRPSRFPALVDAAIDDAIEFNASLDNDLARALYTPERLASIRVRARQMMDEIAYPAAAPPLPPTAGPGAALRPRLECVGPDRGWQAPAGQWAARFAYELGEPASVRVPLGSDNAVSRPSAPGPDGGQPEVFLTPADAASLLPGADTFVAAFDSTGSVSWTLLGQTVTASRWSPRCDAPPPPAQPTCDGRPATVYVGADGRIVGGPDSGEPYAGTLRGTPGPDVLVGTDGPDTLRGSAGDDVLCGLAGDDELRGDNGDDALYGGPGNDALLLGAGHDRAWAGDGDDFVRGAGGDDAAWGGPGADRMLGNGGADALHGGDGDDVLEGGGGDDTLRGGAGADEAAGGGGTDACEAETERSCEADPPAEAAGDAGDAQTDR